MGEARRDKAAVAPGGTNGDLAGLDQEDVLARVALLGLDCGPQAGEPAPDDEEVAGRVAGEDLAGQRAIGAVGPEDGGAGRGEGGGCPPRCGRGAHDAILPQDGAGAAHMGCPQQAQTSPTAGAWRVGLITTR